MLSKSYYWERVGLETGHSSPLLYQKDILAWGGLGVCDGAHWLDVMKKVKSPGQAKLPPTYSRDPLM
jgi:hypothetical protein